MLGYHTPPAKLQDIIHIAVPFFPQFPGTWFPRDMFCCGGRVPFRIKKFSCSSWDFATEWQFYSACTWTSCEDPRIPPVPSCIRVQPGNQKTCTTSGTWLRMCNSCPSQNPVDKACPSHEPWNMHLSRPMKYVLDLVGRDTISNCYGYQVSFVVNVVKIPNKLGT